MKYGTTIHGEWFLNGERLPQKGGKAHEALLPTGKMPKGGDPEAGDPWALSDAPERGPDFPELDEDQATTDGCPFQVGHFSCSQKRTRMPSLSFALASHAFAPHLVSSFKARPTWALSRKVE